MPVSLRYRIRDFEERDKIKIDGKIFDNHRNDIEDYALEKICREEITFDNFVEQYNALLKENDVPLETKLYYIDTNLGARRNKYSNSRKCLWKYGSKMRYYDIDINGEEIVTTDNHPFYVQGRGFIKAEGLFVGDKLISVDGKDLIVETHDIEQCEKTANQMKLLSELKKSYKIIQADADTYISFRKLEEKGITLDDIHEFCNKVYATVNDGEYFTIHSIRSYGFTNIFENAGFGEYFCSALLACDSRFDSQSIFLSIVLSKSNEIGQISKKSFIKSCLSENAPCSPKKLIESVYNKYGVRITDKYEITEAIKNSNFCYDDIIDEIYAIE